MESDDLSSEENSSDNESSDEDGTTHSKNKLSKEHYVFMANNSAHKKKFQQREDFEEINSDEETDDLEELDYEKELVVALEYLEKETKRRKETAKLLKQTERQVSELKEQLEKAEEMLHEQKECLMDKEQEIENLKSVDTSNVVNMNYGQQLRVAEDQVTQLKMKLEELKMVDCEKDKAYAKCKCQIQELESQGAILREEVTKLHESLEKGTSVASIMNECPKCTKMLDSQKRLGLLIDTQRINKGKAGLGYDVCLDRFDDKEKGKEVKEKGKNENQSL